MNTQVKRFNWVPRQSAWEQSVAWRGKRAAMREQFAAASAAVSSGFTTAFTNQTTGIGDLAARAATARMQAAAKAQLDRSA